MILPLVTEVGCVLPTPVSLNISDEVKAEWEWASNQINTFLKDREVQFEAGSGFRCHFWQVVDKLIQPIY